MPDTGDPSRATPIWVGTYEMVVEDGVTIANAWVMLSKQNMVQFMGDAEDIVADQTFATLPEECRPDEAVMMPVVVEESGGLEQQVSITASGDPIDVTIPDLTGSVSFEIPPSVTDPEPTPLWLTMAEGTASIPGTVASVESPTFQATGTVTIPQTIGILTVSPIGELRCNLSGKVHLNGLNFHTCANYY